MEFPKGNHLFSFRLDGVEAWTLDYTSEVENKDDALITSYFFPRGLKITNIVKKYEEYGAYEWVNFLENTSDMPTGIVSDLWDCDCELPLPHEEERKTETFFPDVKTATKVLAPSGSTWSKYEFYCDADVIEDNRRLNHICVGETKRYAASNGRSSEKQAPFFNIHKNGVGYMLAVGWTGQWHCQISRAADSVSVKTGIEDAAFRLMPGEKIRTSSVVLMPYHANVVDSQNLWRRLIRKHFSLIGQPGRDSHGPLSAVVWGGLESDKTLNRIDVIRKEQLPFEYLWMDAGWYGIDTKPSPDEFEGDWPWHTGDWRVSPLIHPNGLEDVAKAVHDAGMKFLLWFEPERVVRTAPVAVEHPEYFLSDDNPNSPVRILDLGNPAAWDYCYRTLSELIERLHIDCYRQDFNWSPLAFWRRKDAPDRRGITEIGHITGLYRLWDALLARFPHLLIDNVASGGRRLDIEMFRRSIPLWRSDHMCPANADVETFQCHSLSFNCWMPYSGTSAGRLYDEYRVRSAYSTSLGMAYLYSQKEESQLTQEQVAFIRKYAEEYKRARPYFSEDFYPLTTMGTQKDIWCAMQFNRPEQNDGLVEVFRREDAPYETAAFVLHGLDAEKTYQFEDADGEKFTVGGQELLTSGLRLTIPEKRKAKLYFYRQV